jgi:GTP cyclohydrolase II
MLQVFLIKDSNGNNLKAFSTKDEMLNYLGVSRVELLDHLHNVKSCDNLKGLEVTVKHY